MARRFVELVFNDFIIGTTPTFTAAQFDELLGSANRLAIQVVADKATGTSPTLSLQVHHAADERSFVSVSLVGGFEILPTALSTTAVTILNGVADYSALFRHVRFRLALGGTNPGAHVKVYATGRDKA
jgi:hypothetical protein